MFQSDSGRTDCVRPLRHSSVAPGMQKAKAPTKGLSELNSMAFGLAVYASWSELPQYHAKLASSCWSGSTERDSHPQGSDERFQICKLHLIPLSQALLGAIASTSASSASPELAAVSVRIIHLSDLASGETCRGWSNFRAQGKLGIARGETDLSSFGP